MAHVCSECGFPMITVVQIEAEAEKTYTFSQSKAEQIASETADNAIQEEIRRIESCYSTKLPIVGKRKGSRMISPGHFCTSSFSGYVSQCPRCLNIEPWKSTTSKKKMDELHKEHFPMVFTDLGKAENWACDIIRKMAKEIEEKRRDNYAVKEAIGKVIDSKIKINQWVTELHSVPETVERDRLKTELTNAEKLKSQLGIFDFKNKKVVGVKVNILKLQIKELNDVIEKKETLIAERIIKLENELLFTQSVAFGCSDDILSKQDGNTFSYFLSPNDIPDNVMEKIENADASNSEIILAPQVEKESDVSPFSDIEKPVFCRKCGYKLLADSTFCTKCGEKVE